jgi:hypothetical protein
MKTVVHEFRGVYEVGIPDEFGVLQFRENKETGGFIAVAWVTESPDAPQWPSRAGVRAAREALSAFFAGQQCAA